MYILRNHSYGYDIKHSLEGEPSSSAISKYTILCFVFRITFVLQHPQKGWTIDIMGPIWTNE